MVSVSLALFGLVGPTGTDTATQLAAVEALASGALVANFRDTRFKSKVPHINQPQLPPTAHNSAEHASRGHTIPVVISWVCGRHLSPL